MALIDELEALLNTQAQGVSDTGLSGQVLDASLEKELARLLSPEALVDPELVRSLFEPAEMRIQRQGEQLTKGIRERANAAGFIDQPFLEREGGAFSNLNRDILAEINRASNLATSQAADFGLKRAEQARLGGEFAQTQAFNNRTQAFNQPFNLFESLRNSRSAGLDRDLNRELSTQSIQGNLDLQRLRNTGQQDLSRLDRGFVVEDQPSAARQFFLDFSESLKGINWP